MDAFRVLRPVFEDLLHRVRHGDLPLLLAAGGLALFGLVPIFSATHGSVGASFGDPFFYVKRQAAWIVVGAAAAAVMMAIDYRHLGRLTPYLYAGNLALLGTVLLWGEHVAGAQSWLRFGPISLQPSEFAKVILIVTLAHQLAGDEPCDSWWKLVKAGLHVAPLLVLVLLQPDLGSSVVFLGILGGMVFLAGARLRHLVAAGGAGVAALLLAAFLSMRGTMPLLKPYQIERLLVFLNPRTDPLGAGYNVTQSQIAIGSGRLVGQGLLQGTQTQLDFLPARHTDFIFSVVGEELGFVGALSLLLVYLLLLWRLVWIGEQARDRYGSLLAGGVLSLIAFHLVINVGMAVGILPVTGLPLPFLSYGGSFLVTNWAAIGLVQGVYVRRKKINLQ